MTSWPCFISLRASISALAPPFELLPLMVPDAKKFDYSGDELAIFVVAYYHLALFSVLAAPPASVSKAHKAKSAVPKDDDAAILW